MSASSEKKKSSGVRANLFVLRLSRRWLEIVLVILAVYITLPWLAPTLMKIGLTGPANLIYTAYSPFCHQFAFRSFFVYGEQPVYPRELAGTEYTPYESYVAAAPEFQEHYTYWYQFYNGVEPAGISADDLQEFSPWLQFASRDFKGNEQMGYKVTLCERDITIYSAMFVGGLLYSRVRWRLRPAPWWLYAILGLAPIAIDGFSQLLGYPPFGLWPARETLPIFRVVTGMFFGLMNVWLGFPYLERSFWDTRVQIERKLRQHGIEF